eukprot:134-Heterococcus_DN1.PRE.1
MHSPATAHDSIHIGFHCYQTVLCALPPCSQVEPFVVGQALDARMSAIKNKRSGPRKGQLEAIEQAQVQISMVRTKLEHAYLVYA